ncbi:MAG: outer membrane receptor for ferrienterochelin and colicins [Salibacteraceae bacterium]|jgi:outer membrane receptor for ferrienterochelin and colicins
MLLISFGLFAQDTKVVVYDITYSKPLPYAHIHFSNIQTGKKESVLTNLKGVAILPLPQNYGALVALQITYVGFSTHTDTIKIGATVKVKMKESTEALKQVVITGQFSESSPEKALHKITLITRDKIDALNAVSLDQVLARELNMNISQDGILGSSISIQGLSGENVKILVDGVPMVGRLNGNIDLSQINLNDIERIEVVEGPLSVSYGSNALAGTINLITKKGSQEPVSGNGKYYTENIGTHNVDARIGLSNGKNYGGATFTRNYFDGWSVEDPTWSNPAVVADSSRVKLWKPRTQHLAGIKYGRILKKGTLLFNVNGFDETIINRGAPRGPYKEVAFDDKYITQRLDHSITLDIKTDSLHTLQVITAYNIYQRQRLSYLTDLTEVSSVPNETPGSNDTNFTDLKMLRATFMGATKSEFWRYQIGTDLNVEKIKGQRILNNEQSIGDYAGFISVEWTPTLKWTVKPGLRASYNTQYGAPIVPSLYAKYQLKPTMSLRGSIARGFRAPSVKELYMDFVDINHDITGNPNLNAETALHTSMNYNYTRFKSGRSFKFKLGVFYNHISNKITLAQSSATQYEYANLDEAISLGFNTEVEYRINQIKASFGFSYTGNQTTIDEADPLPIAYSPQVTSSLSYAFQKTKMDISMFFKYSGKQPNIIMDANNQLKQDFIGSYGLLDLTANKKIWNDHLIIGAGVKNILDVTNITTSANGGSHGSSNGTRPIAPGRVYFLKLGFQF